MSLQTLLEAARFIELQEQQQDRISFGITSPGTNNITSNNISNSRYHNNQQVVTSSPPPPISPVLITGSNHQLIQNNEFSVGNSNVVRIDGRRNDELFVNGHSIAPPLVVISSQNHQEASQTFYPRVNNPQSHNNSHNHNNMTNSPQSQTSTSSSTYELSRSRSSSISSNNAAMNFPLIPISNQSLIQGTSVSLVGNGIHHVINEDSSQSSLNLSGFSSGYLSGSSANSSVGGSNSSVGSSSLNLSINSNLLIQNGHDAMGQSATSSRRRTISSNSNGGTQRSPCILRAGTREVHNKLEKNRRAHLKECFEQLKKQLPLMPEEKKTSNLSILGAAIRCVTNLKRKERELEHEMERLAKEKIAAQQKILLLKRELSAQWDHIDFSTLLPEPEVGIREREVLIEPSLSNSGRGGARYSSSSSLSSAATSSSPNTTTGNLISSSLPTTTTISPVITRTSTNSPRLHSSSTHCSSIMPLSLTSKHASMIDTTSLKLSTHPSGGIQFTTMPTSGTLTHTNNTICGNHNNSVAINLTTNDLMPSMPLNLQGQGLQIISTTKDLMGKNGIRTELRDTPPSLMINSKDSGLTKLDSEPPTKVFKLLHGSTIALASDNKLLQSGPLSLQQVVGNGNLVVSQIPILTSNQGIRVIGQSPNGLATIELSAPNVTQQSSRNQQQIHHMHHQSPQVSGAQLHKLLVSGTTSMTTSTHSTMVQTMAPELARLPGGAELNILPAGSNGAHTLYRSQNKMAIVNNGLSLKGTDVNNLSSRAVHVVTPLSGATTMSGLTPIVVPQGGQSGTTNLAHILASPQLAGKVKTPWT